MTARPLTLLAAVACALPSIAAAEPFTFVTLGDMPYKLPDDNVRFDRLIDAVNEVAPAFTLHIGDTKGGSTPCDDAALEKILADMNRFAAPVIYTPGDNEWTDCYRKNAGEFDPLERLAKLRVDFFPDSTSLGAIPMAVARQPDVMPEHADYVENARFTMNEVMVVTAHVVGSNNNFESRDPDAVAEFFARDAANIAWTKDSFAKAKAEGAKAVVMGIHADLWDAATYYATWPRHSGHKAWVEAFLESAADFGKPVLLIHGDSHVFRIDHPFKNDDDKTMELITRLEVYGANQVQAVRVTVDPDDPAVFGFKPLIVPDNIGR